MAFQVLSLLVACTFLPSSTAQELPSPLFQTNQFNTSRVFRQNVCELAHKVGQREIELEDALQGLEIRTMNALSQYFQLNPKTGALDEEYPGVTAILLDELARRAGFTWRNSYAVTQEPIEGRTWTELLEWTTAYYDISVDWWAHSTARMTLGIVFPEGWYDASIIMVGKENESNEGEFNLWSFLAPFHRDVWIMILITLFTSGLIYYWMERIDNHSDKRDLSHDPAQSLFLATLTFTTHFEFKPKTNPARIFTVSLAFWSMLACSAYTANYASFLVVRNTDTMEITKVWDVVKAGDPICVFADTQADEALTKAYPNAIIVRKEDAEDEIFQGVLDGDCAVAVTTMSSWDHWKRQESVNGDCQLNWIGRTFRFIPAGFATTEDAGFLCTSLIKDVIHIHFLKMKEEGFIDDTWNRHTERSATIDCTDDTKKNEEEHSQQLTLKTMGGIFVLHFGLTFIAIAYAMGYKFFGYMDERDKRRAQRKYEKTISRLESQRQIIRQHWNKEKATRSVTLGIDMTLDDDELLLEEENRLPKTRRSTYRRDPSRRSRAANRSKQTVVTSSRSNDGQWSDELELWDGDDLSDSDASSDDVTTLAEELRRISYYQEEPHNIQSRLSVQGRQMDGMKGDIDLIKNQMSAIFKILKGEQKRASTVPPADGYSAQTEC